MRAGIWQLIKGTSTLDLEAGMTAGLTRLKRPSSSIILSQSSIFLQDFFLKFQSSVNDDRAYICQFKNSQSRFLGGQRQSYLNQQSSLLLKGSLRFLHDLNGLGSLTSFCLTDSLTVVSLYYLLFINYLSFISLYLIKIYLVSLFFYLGYSFLSLIYYFFSFISSFFSFISSFLYLFQVWQAWSFPGYLGTGYQLRLVTRSLFSKKSIRRQGYSFLSSSYFMYQGGNPFFVIARNIIGKLFFFNLQGLPFILNT